MKQLSGLAVVAHRECGRENLLRKTNFIGGLVELVDRLVRQIDHEGERRRVDWSPFEVEAGPYPSRIQTRPDSTLTRSDYNVIAQEQRDRLLAEVEKALAPLGELSLRNETHLYLAELKF